MQKLPTFYGKVNFYEKVTDFLKNNKFGTFGIDP